ncbi:hypothetical protein TH53_19780 [Pedobacter lusitanus]|uniref:Phage major capsid protein n=1 Tax=Pedobacter lusitanus TaxID=1503925 RepID=A0A0D0GMA2_9SPHI|nr:phage major capsid protein [Pedobacter lusitanus]KIO75581.1 hypothetical protein TH53_19780 [Pedobacter lusitanus]
MFKYKNDEELSKMTAAERDEYAADKRTHEKGLLEKLVNDTVEGLKTELTNAQKDEIKTQLAEVLKGREGVSKAEFDEVKEHVAQIKESKSNFGFSVFGDEAMYQEIEKGLVEFLPKVKAEAKKQAGSEKDWDVEMEIKAPVNITTGAITNAAGVNTPVSYVYQQVTDYAEDVRGLEYIIKFLSSGGTNKSTIPFMDKLPNQGTMAITAEGALKPLISISFKLNYSQAQKVSGRAKLSEEALDDIPFIMSTIRNELKYEHDMAVQSAIFTKVASFAPAFVAGGMAASTSTPSNFDAIRASIYAVKIQSKGKFIPNMVLVPSADSYNMGATKDTLGQYVLPTFVLPDGSKISGVQVVEVSDGTVADGSFILGDWNRLHYNLYKVFTIRIGQGINTIDVAGTPTIVSDFESNMYTILGESRFHLWIYENEKVAFVKSTFAAVKTAIEKPAA